MPRVDDLCSRQGGSGQWLPLTDHFKHWEWVAAAVEGKTVKLDSSNKHRG